MAAETKEALAAVVGEPSQEALSLDPTVDSKTEPSLKTSSLDSESMLMLVSKEGKKFSVSVRAAMISKLVVTARDYAAVPGVVATIEPEGSIQKIAAQARDAPLTEVEANNVDAVVLEQIVRYMKHHNGEESPPVDKPVKPKEPKVSKDQWDEVFICDVTATGKLHDMIFAANYMEIPGLLGLACAKSATYVRAQPLEKILEMMKNGIPADLYTQPAGPASHKAEEKKE